MKKKTEYKIATFIFFGLTILGLIVNGVRSGKLFAPFCFLIGIYCAIRWYRLRDKKVIEKQKSSTEKNK